VNGEKLQNTYDLKVQRLSFKNETRYKKLIKLSRANLMHISTHVAKRSNNMT
jgi:hypothetical protein